MPCYVLARKGYIKYTYSSWTQPVLTSNTSSPKMVLSATSIYASGYPMWHAFDSSTSTAWLSQSKVPTASLRVSFPNKLRITSITVTGWKNPYGATKTVAIYKDMSDTSLIGATQPFNGNGTYTWVFSTPVITDVLSFYTVGTIAWACIGNIKITATELGTTEGTASSYDYIGTPKAYVFRKGSQVYFPVRKSNWKQKYANYTLPTMTARSSADGYVQTNVANGDYTIDAYNFFFNKHWHFEAEGRTGSRYNYFTFANPLKAGTYTVSFEGNIQSQDRNTGTLSVWYTDGSKESLISYTLTTTRTTYSKQFTTTKLIKKIGIDMTVSTNSHKNDVTNFYNLNIVPSSGTLQAFVGYEQA